MIGLIGPTTGLHYGWSQEAFARRCITMLDSRSYTSVAQVVAALSAMPFTAPGWLTLKKILSELVAGSIAFPGDLSADGAIITLGGGEITVATRDVSSTIT